MLAKMVLKKRFIAEFPNLNESTVRYFKRLYQQKIKEEAKKDNPLPVTALPTQPRGRPPLLLELDAKLIKFLQAVRRNGGVINIHVVRATAEALASQHLRNSSVDLKCPASGSSLCTDA